MKNIKNYCALAFTMLISVFVLASCSDEDTVNPLDLLEQPTLEINDPVNYYNGADVTINTKNATGLYYRYSRATDNGTIDETDENSKEWKTATIDEEGNANIHFDLPASLAGRVRYVMEAYVVNISSDNSEILKKSEPVLKMFQSTQANRVEISNLEYSPTQVRFDAKILKELDSELGGFIYQIRPKMANDNADAYNEEDFKKELEYSQVITIDSTITELSLLPNTEYVLAIAPVKTKPNEWDETAVSYDQLLGNIITTEFYTNPYTLNDCQANVTIEGQSANFNSLTVKITADDTAKGYMVGAVKTADMGGKSAEEFINASSWMNNNANEHSGTFLAFDWDTGSYKMENPKSVIITNVQSNTEYTVFVIALDELGRVGKVNSIQYNTTTLTFDSKADATVKVADCDYSTITLNCAMNSECKQVAYAYFPTNLNKTEAEGQEAVLGNTGMYGQFLNEGENVLYNMTDGDYDLFILPIDANGQFGKVQHSVISTKQIIFGGSATCSVSTITNVSYDGIPNVAVEIKKGSNCSSVIYRAFGKSAVYETNPNATDIDYAKYLIASSYYETSSESTINYTFDIYFEDYVLVAIPQDANGVNGVPVVVPYSFASSAKAIASAHKMVNAKAVTAKQKAVKKAAAKFLKRR